MDSNKSAQLLFQIVIDDIRYSKKQQWYVFYLTLIALAGIISLSLALCKQFDSSVIYLCLSFKDILKVAAWFISIAGFSVLICYRCDICRYRKKKDKLIQKLGLDDDVKEIYEDSNKTDKLSDYTFLFMFVFTIVIGLLITIKIIENL